MADEKQMGQNPAIPPQPEEQAEPATTPSRTAAKAVWDDAIHRVRNFRGNSEQYVRENPMKAVCAALGVGFVLGLTFRR